MPTLVILIVMLQHTSTPLGNTSLSGESPESCVAKCKYERRSYSRYLLPKFAYPFQDKCIRLCPFAVEEEILYLIFRRPVLADVGEEGVGAREACLVKHSIELLAA